MNKKQLAIAAMVPVLGLTLAGNAFAATETTTKNMTRPVMGEMREGRPDDMGMHEQGDRPEGNRGEHGGSVNDTELQKVLGMTADQIKSALQSGKTMKDLITAKGLDFASIMKQLKASHDADMQTKIAADVKSGKITQAQADEMQTKRTERETKEIANLANVLGTTTDKIKADRDNGKSLDETITSLGLDKNTVMQKLQASHDADMKANLAADVASGKITQAQADEMTKKMTEMKTKRDETVAKALGITTDELTTLTKSGKSIDDIITEKGLSKDTVKAALDAARPADAPKGFFKKMGKKIKGMFGGMKKHTDIAAR
jgi:lambda repressor-like predicted transcriptional regulator